MEKFKEYLKIFLKKLIDFVNKIPPFLFKCLIIILITFIVIIIVMISVNASFSGDLKGTCIEADEFGSRKNIILAKPKSDNSYTLNNAYEHEQIRQKVEHTDLGLSLNGDPISINITGKWIPWLGDYSDRLTGNEGAVILNSELENGGLPADNFFCALEKYTIEGSNFTFSNKYDENEFYYVKNYYKSIDKYYNDTNSSVKININGKELYTVEPGNSLVYGYENVPEKQKECWITRGAGLYMGSYGVSGKTQPTAYHHLIASKMICSKSNWFSGDIENASDVITTYKKPSGVDWNNCEDASGKSCTCEDKRSDLGTCSYYSDASANVLVDCDCKTYTTENYTYADFLANYFDVEYHLADSNSLDSSLSGSIIEIDSNQIVYNIETHENLLYEHNVDNVGYIVAASMEKFANACYEKTKSITGDYVRTYKSYFQYGPKTIYKNVSDLQNVKYSYGEKIKMFIADKYYKDNDGFYNIEIISGIELDDAGSFESKLQEIEFFLLGTPNPGQDDDRTDGMVATIFNNILSSGFVTIARIVMVFSVMVYGFCIIFGFLPKEDAGAKYKYKLMKMTLKICILSVFLSPSAFQFFTTIVINFFVNGTIGIVDLIAGIFSNSFMDNTISLTSGLQYANETLSLSRNFAIVDEILAFFDGYSVTAKVLSFFFNLDQMFMIGVFISTAIFLALLFYVAKLIQSIVPFVFVLLQLTMVLPLAPFCLMFSLLDQTKFILDGWIKFVLSKCLELVAFFTAFYFCTSIINNFIKTLLSFRVCFVGLGDYLMPSVGNEVTVDGVRDFFEFNWFVESVKLILNNFIAATQDGLPDNWFLVYCINIAIIFALIALFDTLVKNVMEIISSILTIDGASAAGGPLSDTSKFGVQNQLAEFADKMGLAQIQKDSKLLAWTRNIVDLSNKDIISGNAGNIMKGVGGYVGDVAGAAGQAMYDKARGVESHFGSDVAKITGKALDNVTTDPEEKNKGEKDREDSVLKGTILDPSKWGEKDGSELSRYDSNDLNDEKKVDGKSDWASRAKNNVDDWVDNLFEGDNKNKNSPVSKEYSNLSKKQVMKELNELKPKDAKDTKDFYNKLSKNKSELNKLKRLLGKDAVDSMILAMQLNNSGKLSNSELEKVFEKTTNALQAATMYERDLLKEEIQDIIGEDRMSEAVDDLMGKDSEEGDGSILIENPNDIEENTSLLDGDSTSLLEQDVSNLIEGNSCGLLDQDSSVLMTAKKIAEEKEKKSKIEQMREDNEKREKQEKKRKEREEAEADSEK